VITGHFLSVASLGLVSPGAATDGVTLYFLKKLTTFLVIALYKVLTFLVVVSLQTPTFRRRFSGVLLKFSHKEFFISFGVTPWLMSPEAVRLPPTLVTPLFLATSRR